jgi:hypothetical protein
MAYGDGLGSYSLGDLYRGDSERGPVNYFRPDDNTAAIIAALLAQRQSGLVPVPIQAPAGPAQSAQVPVSQIQAPRHFGSMTFAPASAQDNGQSSTQQALKLAKDLSSNRPSGSTVTTASPPGSGTAQPIDLSSLGSGGLGSVSAGQMFGTSGSSALGAAAPVSTDAALSNLDTATPGQLFGTSGSAAAGAGPGSLGQAGGAGGLGAQTGASAAKNGAFDAGGTLADGIGLNDLFGIYGAYDTLANKKGKFGGALSGAMAGNSLAGWPGAIIGGAVGYARNGGIPDANPLKASGFTGITMDQAWKDQNLMRLASNPAASVASKLGLGSHTFLGKLIDPSGWF